VFVDPKPALRNAFQNPNGFFCDHAIKTEFAEEGLAESTRRPIIKGPDA
jgi:hypothetical protein